MAENNNNTKETNLDSLMGRMAVTEKLCTPDEVKECIDQVKERAQKELPLSLAEALVDKGYVTNSQLDRLQNKVQEARPSHRIPGYQMLEKLGAGAMAVVFKAKQVSLDRLVAIKVLPKRLSENPEYVERFYKEGKAAAMLNHNNIVQAIDVGQANGLHYFVMEFVKGKTVYDDICNGKPYSEAEALNIITQIGEALEHAHERGLIHRDVKPKNIMITEDGIAKLADMGLAREATDTAAAEMEAGRAYGTPYYISPEQIRGERNIDFRADIYSLGATLYHMVTGKVPFEAPTPSAVMHKHLKEPLVPPDHINSSLSVGLAEVVEVMMAKNRDERYSSMKLLLEDLQAVRAGEQPLQAHRKIDKNMLADLEKGADIDVDLERKLGPVPGLLGWKMATIILAGALVVTLLIIMIMATSE